MPIEIVPLNGDGFTVLCPRFAEIFRAVYTAPPFYDSEADLLAYAATLPGYLRREGFRCLVARDADGDDRIAGFAFGHRLRPGNFWWDPVASALDEAARARWLADCFVLAEFAMDPAYQGRGTGGRLHDALLASVPNRTAILSTPQLETVARVLYARRGWRTLLSGYHFPGRPEPYLVLVRDRTSREQPDAR